MEMINVLIRKCPHMISVWLYVHVRILDDLVSIRKRSIVLTYRLLRRWREYFSFEPTTWSWIYLRIIVSLRLHLGVGSEKVSQLKLAIQFIYTIRFLLLCLFLWLIALHWPLTDQFWSLKRRGLFKFKKSQPHNLNVKIDLKVNVRWA